MQIIVVMTVVAGTRNDYLARSCHSGESFIIKLLFSVERFMTALAKRNDTWFACFFGIVEDVFKAESIGGCGVFIELILWN